MRELLKSYKWMLEHYETKLNQTTDRDDTFSLLGKIAGIKLCIETIENNYLGN
jgi:hypothetical protein